MTAPVRDGSGPCSHAGPAAQQEREGLQAYLQQPRAQGEARVFAAQQGIQFVLVEGRLALSDEVLYRRNWRGDRSIGLLYWEWVQEARSTGHQLHCIETWMLTWPASVLSVDGVVVVHLVRTTSDQQEPQPEPN